MILLVKDYNEKTPSLIIEKTMMDEEYHIPLPYGLQKLIIIQLPYIEEIERGKEVLSEFEAMIYLIYKGTVEGINYEEKEGVIQMMKEKKEEYIKEETALYDATMQRDYFTINWDRALEDAIEENKEKCREEYKEIYKEIGLQQGFIESALLQIQLKYNEDASSWIREYDGEILKRIILLLCQNITYEEFIDKINE